MGSSDYEPLLRRPIGDLERELLESAKGDAPDPNGCDRMLASLGKTVPAAPKSGIRLSEIVRNGYVLCGLGIVVAIGASVVPSFSQSNVGQAPSAQDVNPTERASSSSEARATLTTSDAPTIADEAPSEMPTVSLDALPNVGGEHAPVARRNTLAKRVEVAVDAKAPSDDAQSSLMREIKAVEAARASLSAGDATRTLSILDEYQREFPKGAFSVEVSVLRIEALARAGRTSEAKALGERFLESHREGAFARRVASTLDRLH